MHIFEAEDGKAKPRKEYFCTLQTAGFADIVKRKSHIAINHIRMKLKPQQLFLRTMDTTDWQRSENFYRKDFDRFVQDVDRQAKETPSERRAKPVFAQSENSEKGHRVRSAYHTRPVRLTIKPQQKHIRYAAPIRQVYKTNEDELSKKRKRDVPVIPQCLNPNCREQRKSSYLANCEISNKNTGDLVRAIQKK